MWLIAMFDLPVETKEDRRAHALFRKDLLKLGFVMLQFSVYARCVPSEESGAVFRKAIRHALPSRGNVRILTLTDAQYARTQVFEGTKPQTPEHAPAQLELF